MLGHAPMSVECPGACNKKTAAGRVLGLPVPQAVDLS